MPLTLDSDQEKCKAALSGELTVFTIHEWQEELFGLLHHERIELDLSGLSELDGCGLQLLLLLQAQSLACGHPFVIGANNPLVHETFALVGIALPPPAGDSTWI